MEVTELLAFTMQSKASDLHLSSGNPPLLRVSGDLRPLKVEPLTGDQVKAMLYSIMTEEQRSDYESEKDLDFAIAFGGVRSLPRQRVQYQSRTGGGVPDDPDRDPFA